MGSAPQPKTQKFLNCNFWFVNKFKTFHKFASSSLSEIYSPSNLEDALVYEVNELSSGFLINDGKGHFTFKAMPNMVQNSPIFGIDFNDVNGDGFLDIYHSI